MGELVNELEAAPRVAGHVRTRIWTSQSMLIVSVMLSLSILGVLLSILVVLAKGFVANSHKTHAHLQHDIATEVLLHQMAAELTLIERNTRPAHPTQP